MRARSRISAIRPEISASLCLPFSASMHRVQRRLGILDHQQARGAEGDHAIADFRTDRTAAAGDDDRLAAHERLEPAVIDRDARPQQQILDRHRRELHRLPAGVERRQLAHRQAELARPYQKHFRPRLRRQRRRRQDDARHPRAAAGEIGDHAFEIVDVAQHRNAADRLAAVGRRTATGCRPARSFSPRRFRSSAAELRRRRRGRAPASASHRRS